MDFYPHATRAFKRRLKAHTKLDNVTRHFEPDRLPLSRTRGKLRKDDSGAKSVQDYLADRYIDAQITKGGAGTSRGRLSGIS